MTDPLSRALRSLDGLALCDAFGELAFEHSFPGQLPGRFGL